MSTTGDQETTVEKKIAKKVKPPTQKELLNQRLTKIESAIERLASLQPLAPTLPATNSTTTQRPSRIDFPSRTDGRRSVSLDTPSRDRSLNIPHSTFTENVPTRASIQPLGQPRDSPDVATRQDVQATATRPTDTASAWNVNTHTRRDILPDVNKYRHWDAWIPAASPTHQVDSFGPVNRAEVSHQYPGDPANVESQVQQILASTAHSLSRGTVKFDYPFKYISRGPEKKKLALNQVTLAEHLWGILRMVKDEKTDPSLIRPLLAHLEDVIEDSCDFDWPRVRRWSEEVFCLVSEKRLPQGWVSTNKIQMLRMSMSRLELGMLQTPKEQQPRRQYSHQQHQPQTQSYSADPPKGGPPCQAYNSPSGCPLPAGHFINGRRMSHVCSFCLVNSSAAYTHPESQCRNKVRFPPPHFQ